LMEGAVQEFRDYMAAIPFSEPRSRMLFNATAAPETDPETIKDIMAKQLISPVLWYDIMVCMLGEGVTTFVEVGPKKVLTGLLKKTVTPDHPVHVYNVEDAQSLRRFVEENA
jgi:[acyl-carrier-protein] S-malonyltransferase